MSRIVYSKLSNQAISSREGLVEANEPVVQRIGALTGDQNTNLVINLAIKQLMGR